MRVSHLVSLSVVGSAAVILAGCNTDKMSGYTDPAPAPIANITDSMADKDMENHNTDSQPAMAVNKYQDYSADLAKQLEDNDQSYVLFFHADWCSTCRRREQDIQASLSTMPDNTVILKANFDRNADVRKDYDVTVKDTFVFIDENQVAQNKAGATVETLNMFFNQDTVATTEDKVQGIPLYTEYDAAMVETFKGKKPYALFFHATWCPACAKVDQEISAAVSTLPRSIALFKTDYDSHLDLRKEYGVTQQHTAVFFDATGEVAKVKPGFDLEDVLIHFAG